MDCIRDCVRRVGKFTKLCHYMLVLDERSLYFSLTPEDDRGLVKSLKVGRSIPDLVYDVGIDIQSYVPSPASPIERIGVPRWPRLGYFKSEDFVRYCQWFMPGDAVSTGTGHGRFVRYRKPHAGLPMCEVMVGKVLHIIREYLLEPVV